MQGSEWVAYRCRGCGYVNENGPSNWVNVSAGDYCVKCGREFEKDDRGTRTTGGSYEWG